MSKWKDNSTFKMDFMVAQFVSIQSYLSKLSSSSRIAWLTTLICWCSHYSLVDNFGIFQPPIFNLQMAIFFVPNPFIFLGSKIDKILAFLNMEKVSNFFFRCAEEKFFMSNVLFRFYPFSSLVLN